MKITGRTISYSKPFLIGLSRPELPVPLTFVLLYAILKNHPSWYCATPNSWHGYCKRSTDAPQSSHRRGFAAHHRSSPCRLPGKGKTYSFTFTKPGSYTYYCDIHQGMNATIVVVADSTSTEGAQK